MRLAVFVAVLFAAALLAACDSGVTDNSCPGTDLVTVADSVVGTGQPASGTVSVDYVGRLASNGSVFDQGTAVSFPLSGVIAGFRQGIGGRPATESAKAIEPMRTGGIRRIRVPANFGYGAAGSGPIPSCADLIFDVKLRDP